MDRTERFYKIDQLLNDRRSVPMQTLIEFCSTPTFTERAREFSGYDVSGWGTVHFNGA